jgi:hypothetical protein
MGQNQKMNVCCMWVMIIVPFPTIINEEQSLFTNQNSNPNLTISNHVKNMDFLNSRTKIGREDQTLLMQREATQMQEEMMQKWMLETN